MTAKGGCLCGAVRYRIETGIGPAGYCHCADCRKLTGGPFGISAPVATDGFFIDTGKLGKFTKCGDSGRELTRHFCSDCGSPIFTSAPAHPQTVYIKGGTLDDPSLIAPALEAWCSSKVEWARIPLNLRQFSKGRST